MAGSIRSGFPRIQAILDCVVKDVSGYVENKRRSEGEGATVARPRRTQKRPSYMNGSKPRW